jgi:orotate phosphoribosyltransferase
MMSADVLRFGSFVTKSGRSTPYFVNTGNYKTGEQIAKLGKFYAALIKETVGEDFTAMFGPAYKGIPLVTADRGRRCTTSTGSRSPTSSTARRRKTTAKAAASWATSRPTATGSSSSRT